MTDLRDFAHWAHPLFARSGHGGRRSLWGLMHFLESGELRVPAYQRGRVWTDEQKSAWVGYVLSQGPLPAVFIREVNEEGGFRDEIVDGQQRLWALLDWTRGLIPARLWSGEEVMCETEMHRRMLTRLAIPCESLPPETTDRQAMELYLLLNTAGTPHTQAELARVRRMLKEAPDA